MTDRAYQDALIERTSAALRMGGFAGMSGKGGVMRRKYYAVKEIFYSLHGEGANVGRPAVFCRFSGCNLSCSWCDTDYAGTDGPGGGVYQNRIALADAIDAAWRGGGHHRFVIFTGGEPLLQLDALAIDTIRNRGFITAVETNGTVPIPLGLNWVCVSPKAGAALVVTRGHELKLVYPQDGIDPEMFTAHNFRHFWLQPMDGPNLAANTAAAVAYCLAHPRWRLSLQTHKIIGVR